MRVSWAGSPLIGSGLSTFYFNSPPLTSDVTIIRSFFSALGSSTPVGLQWQVPDGGEDIDETTGALTGAWGTTTTTGVTASSTSSFSEGVGARITFATAGIVAGRRVRGTLFLVPLAGNAFGTNGLLLSTAQTGIQTAAQTMIGTTAAKFVVWSRPVPSRAGSFHLVTNALVPANVTWLRSRRT